MEIGVAGLDEVGRGCLAGPVIAAAVILPEFYQLDGLADSKTLTPKQREILAHSIQTQSVAWAIGRAEVTEIDRINILKASFLAMQRACVTLSPQPHRALVDGNHYPSLPYPGKAIVRGDALVPVIAAASILAKVYRDREMVILDTLFPGYGFAQHKGYPTTLHQKQLKKLGPCLLHRRSFSPVKKELTELHLTTDLFP